MIEVRFFAQLREELGVEILSLETEGLDNMAQLRARLLAEHPEWQEALGRPALLLAVNHALVKLDHPVREGDEVAFMPPVTGG